MINCKEYKQILRKLNIDKMHEIQNDGSGHKVVVKTVKIIADLLANDNIGPEWFFSLLDDIRKKCGW